LTASLSQVPEAADNFEFLQPHLAGINTLSLVVAKQPCFSYGGFRVSSWLMVAVSGHPLMGMHAFPANERAHCTEMLMAQHMRLLYEAQHMRLLHSSQYAKPIVPAGSESHDESDASDN
jgi:hypothetical protein